MAHWCHSPCGPQGPAHGRDTQVWMRRTLHVGTGSHLEPTAPTSALPVGRGGLGGSRCRRTGRAPAASSWPGTLPPEQPGSEGPRHCLVFLSVFAASSLLHVRICEVREREAGDAGGGDGEPGVGGCVRPAGLRAAGRRRGEVLGGLKRRLGAEEVTRRP